MKTLLTIIFCLSIGNVFCQVGFINSSPTPRLDVTPMHNYYDASLKALEIRQAQMEKDMAQSERDRENEKQRARAKMQQIKAYYSSVTTYPERISDGWHNVVVMDNYDYCEDRKVFVSNNQITKYVIDDWIEKTVTFTGVVTKGKTLIKLKQSNNTESDFLDVYFIEDILNPSTKASTPLTPGRVSFWANFKNSGNLKVYFDGIYIGSFEGYFKKGMPTCGEEGTLTYTYKPGTYNFRVETEAGQQVGDGNITVVEGGCALQGLSR